MNEAGYEPSKTTSTLHFAVRQVPLEQGSLDWLMSLIPDNTLVGTNDEIPGVKGSRLPMKIEQLN